MRIFNTKLVKIFFALFLIMVPTVMSIGMSSMPLPKLYFFEPNMELNINMVCSDYTDDCEPYAAGAFSELVTFSEMVQVGNKEKSFKVTVRTPSEVSTPGRHSLYIGVADVIENMAPGIIAITKVQKVLKFMVLYDTKYIEFLFSAPNINEDETQVFSFEVSNFGKPNIMLAYGKVDIFNIDGKKVGSVQSGSTGIKSTETKTLRAEWDSSGNPGGEYRAVGTLLYDGIQEFKNQTFIIGKNDVEVMNYTKEFEVGKISRMDIGVRNKWNGPIHELYAVVKTEQTEFKTPTVSLSAFQRGTLTGYLDAGLLEPGRHKAEITLYFDGNQKTKKGRIKVYNPEGQGLYLPMQIGLNLTTALALIILILILFNIMMILLMRRKKRRKEKKKK